MRTRSRIETLPHPVATRRGGRVQHQVTDHKPYVLATDGLEALLRSGQTLVVAVQLSQRS
jgi:hypothetical protein